MKFKEIKPGMVIHCPKEEDARTLLEHLKELGYTWDTEETLEETYYDEGDTYFLEQFDGAPHSYVAHDSYKWAALKINDITEFSDLIEPDDSPIDSPTDSPMSAVEALEWLKNNGGEKYNVPLYEVFGFHWAGSVVDAYNAQEIVDKITAYEAAKKAPKPVEVEEGYHCCVYRDTGLSINEYILWGVDEQTAKDDAIGKAMQYTKENGELAYAAVDFVCRVKEGEA